MVTFERLSELFDIDVEQGTLVWKKLPHIRAHRSLLGKIAGSPSGNGYLTVSIDGEKYYVHHIIWFVAKGYWPVEIDHWDTNKLNNGIANLRDTTHNQNRANNSTYKNNKSGYKGVTQFRDKWRSSITVNYKQIHLGVFDAKHDAIVAYNKAAIKYHGEFARLNEVSQ